MVHRLVICKKINCYVSHILYAISLSQNTSASIAFKYVYYVSLDTCTTLFSWWAVNNNKREHILADNFYILHIR